LTRDGAPVDPSALDWSRLTPRNFPYVLEQRAGPQNVLGQVKFIFPNPFFVFLHDTPQKTLFDAAQRTFSSGCIRVEDAVTLAELVLDDPRWTRARLEAEIATGRTHTVHLSTPLPVLVLYWTASVDAHGHVRFLPDVYGRDPRVLAALDAPAS
jgi:murein L,D-transpeptidase YcbB/YkuD